jgi:hypothetical protein
VRDLDNRKVADLVKLLASIPGKKGRSRR